MSCLAWHYKDMKEAAPRPTLTQPDRHHLTATNRKHIAAIIALPSFAFGNCYRANTILYSFGSADSAGIHTIKIQKGTNGSIYSCTVKFS